MIRPIDIRLNAAHPELPLPEATTYTGAPSTVLIRGVPGNCGKWAITSVAVAATYPDNSTTTRSAVQSANGVWVATIPATASSGRTTCGLRVLADGIDENGDAVTGYILGIADFAVWVMGISPAPDPGDTCYQMRYFETTPNPAKKGDVAKIGGVLKFYNGTAWEPFAAPVTFDNAVTPSSGNGVKSSGIWSAIWGARSALPTGFTSSYDWCVAKLRGKTDLAVYGYGNATVALPNGFSITYYNMTYTAPAGGETITFVGPVPSSNPYTPNDKFYYPSNLGTLDSFDPNDYSVWCLVVMSGSETPDVLMYKTGPSYNISNWNSTSPTLTLSNGEATGGAPTMTRPLGTTGDTLAKVTQMNATTMLNQHYTDWACSPATSVYENSYFVTWDLIPDTNVYAWCLFTGIPEDKDFVNVGTENANATSFTVEGVGGETVTATRTASGYILGSQTNKPLASEEEAEALRTGKANHASPTTAGNLAALDALGNPTDSGIAAGDLLTIVTLTDSTETMASILARLNTINAAHKHVFFDCSGINVNPRLYLCTIMIDADANAVRVYDQVTGKLYIGPYVATETIGEVFAKAVDAYHSITVSAVTLDGVTVTGQTVTIREGTDAAAPVYATATITNGSPVTFVVPKGMIYFLEITDALADHFGPRVTSGAKQGIATVDAAVTFTYYDAEHIDVSEITTFAKLQEALTWFGTNETAARNNLVGIEIADTWTATNGTVYDNPRVVWDVHYFEDENGVSHLGALMGTKYCSSNDVQFDAAEGEECDSATETTAEADVYYYGLALGETSKTAANLTLLELSTGDTLPYADYAKIYKSAIRDTTRNSLQYGYNNWRDSAYRQYLNSDAEAGQWWGATHIGDVAPQQLSIVRGFMAGCSAALLAAAKKVKIATWPNYVTDGLNQITTLYETLDTFFLPSGSEVYGSVNLNSGESVEGELSPYWQARTAYIAPNNTAISTRIVYRELPVGSTANRPAALVRLRSASRGYSNYVWFVSTSGQVTNIYASYAYASVPACVIY